MPSLFRSKLFTIVLGLLAVVLIVWFFVVDLVVEMMIEKQGTDKVGAKVELAEADLGLFPAGIELRGLQVTNPHEPMTNALDIRRIYGNIELSPLLKKKIIIPELALEGVKMGTKRSSSGALPGRPAPKKPKAEGVCSEAQTPSLTMPDIDEILDRADLQSLESISSLESDIQAARKDWQGKLAELPDTQEIMAYKDKLEALSDQKDRSLGSLLSSGSQAMSVAKELKADLDRLEEAKQAFTEGLEQYRQKVRSASQAPMRDVGRLMDKYSLSAEGLSNLSALLFGDSLCTWTNRAVDWYNRIKPMLEGRGQNGTAEQPADQKGATPDFLVRKALVSVNLASGDFSGTIRNITTNQRQFGTPLSFDFSGTGLSRLQSVSLEGSLDHTKADMYKDAFELALQGLKLTDVSLSDSKSWPLKLQEGLLNLDLDGRVMSGSLMAEAMASFDSTSFQLPLERGAGRLAESVASVLQDVSGLNLSAQLTGSLEEYALQISSDLDKTLRQAAGKAVKQQTASLKQELTKAVRSKTEEPLQGLQGQLSEYSAIGQTLSKRLQTGRELLSESGLSI
jgi:uncharacterized protein (TIGR03545 family)